MLIITYIVLLFVCIQFFNACFNLIFQQRMKDECPDQSTRVSILIPARNEADKIIDLLEDLKQQNYQNIEVIVYDDLSEDNTAELVKSFNDSRFHLIRGRELPNNWLGKNHACHHLAAQAKGDYLLFIDADVRIGNDIISRALHYSKSENSHLLSIFPKQITKTFGEQISVPIMNYILLTLLPLILVRKSIFPSHAAANGQFMMFEGKTYSEIEPHSKFRTEKVEDICISRYFKTRKNKVSCHASDSGVECRMYRFHREAILGFSKNVSHFFGKSHLLGYLFITFIVGCIPLSAIYMSPNISLSVALLQLLTVAFTSIASRQNIFRNIRLFPAQIGSLTMMLTQSLINSFKKQHQWKGRIYKS